MDEDEEDKRRKATLSFKDKVADNFRNVLRNSMFCMLPDSYTGLSVSGGR